MRISLLLQREPFGQIVEQTLARFWSERHGQPYYVEWRMAAPITPDRSVPAAQTWFANIYLNAIFTADAQPAVFDPVRREFSRSTTWWKRPAQQIYTALALGQPSARWLTQARLAVSPPVPDAGNLLIVAGNRKIRLLDRRAGLAFGVQKTGFRPEFMAHELAGRLQARAAGVRTPALLAQSGRGAWYCEQYISGTPINRLANRAAARAAATQAASNLQRLLQATAVERDIGDYVDGLQPLIGKLAAASPLLTTVQREAIEAMTSALVARARQRSGQITLALTHGDFQPANILVNEDGIWLIDWEFSGQRQAGYDALTLALNARFPHGLADRMQALARDGWPDDALVSPVGWPGLAVDQHADRRLHLAIYALEELALHLAENDEPLLTHLNPGFDAFLAEVARWLEMDHE
ncbi:MAG: phosphotransferase [Anaerolineales bacterium]|nr:phosphotransferase [Anaerolineales bacterium]